MECYHGIMHSINEKGVIYEKETHAQNLQNKKYRYHEYGRG